jgi:hypothetical protein
MYIKRFSDSWFMDIFNNHIYILYQLHTPCLIAPVLSYNLSCSTKELWVPCNESILFAQYKFPPSLSLWNTNLEFSESVFLEFQLPGPPNKVLFTFAVFKFYQQKRNILESKQTSLPISPNSLPLVYTHLSSEYIFPWLPTLHQTYYLKKKSNLGWQSGWSGRVP